MTLHATARPCMPRHFGVRDGSGWKASFSKQRVSQACLVPELSRTMCPFGFCPLFPSPAPPELDPAAAHELLSAPLLDAGRTALPYPKGAADVTARAHLFPPQPPGGQLGRRAAEATAAALGPPPAAAAPAAALEGAGVEPAASALGEAVPQGLPGVVSAVKGQAAVGRSKADAGSVPEAVPAVGSGSEPNPATAALGPPPPVPLCQQAEQQQQKQVVLADGSADLAMGEEEEEEEGKEEVALNQMFGNPAESALEPSVPPVTASQPAAAAAAAGAMGEAAAVGEVPAAAVPTLEALREAAVALVAAVDAERAQRG